MSLDNIRECYQLAESKIEQTLKHHLLPDFSANEVDKNEALLRGPLGQTLCDRLYRMQYLSAEQRDNFIDIQSVLRAHTSPWSHEVGQWLSTFSTAIKTLQSEAGLHCDAWFGHKSFTVLQQVYSFEAPTELESWFSKPACSKFLNRAIYVRLRALGLLPGKTRRFFTKPAAHELLNQAVEAGLGYWQQLLYYWGALDPNVRATKLNLLQWLFDTDGITRFINTKAKQLFEQHKQLTRPIVWNHADNEVFPDVTPAELPRLSLRVIMAQARIEAWLNGFGSKQSDFAQGGDFYPGAPIDAYRYSEFFKPRYKTRYTSALPRLHPELKRIICLWDDFERVKRGSADKRLVRETHIARAIQKKQLTVIGIALRTLHCVYELDTLPSQQTQLSPTINQHYAALSQDERNPELWHKQSIGAACLDGLKRAFKWVYKTVSRVFYAISGFVQRVIRVVKSVAIQGMTLLSQVSDIVGSGIELLVNKVLVDKEQFKVVGDQDFDLTTLHSAQCSELQMREGTVAMLHRSMLFKIACGMFRILLSVFKITAGVVTGRAWEVIDGVLLMANYYQSISEQDKAKFQLALEGYA
ncbi:hypothetical protein CWC18_13850 [Pseudoalteromonas aurantia]|uniref:hypothetical protein n=1 Tax=Pseudoalteromonas aurantia TaxID=43654 RepID=UPI00110BB568|nr:hypothetical protein [Pseudoalteromonas aurantia]TMO60336.1 hypothetical protein CWC18_13850 [Pseudoalteromonas aurantia]